MFAAAKGKFSNDLDKSLKHARDGFIFMTNQRLSPGQRRELETLAGHQGKRCLIYHLEYLRVILDSPLGYAVRLRHLRIPLSVEEQFAYFTAGKNDISSTLAGHTRAIERLTSSVERLGRAQGELALHTVAVVADAVRSGGWPSTDVEAMLKASAEAFRNAVSEPATTHLSANLSTSLIRYVHRLIVDEEPLFSGEYRATQVWLADPAGTIVNEIEFPPWDKIPTLMEELVTTWNSEFPTLLKSDEAVSISAIAQFLYRLLSIHPFIDGNGRIAREMASLQAREIFGLGDNLLIDRGTEYNRAFLAASQGDLSLLEELITQAVADAR